MSSGELSNGGLGSGELGGPGAGGTEVRAQAWGEGPEGPVTLHTLSSGSVSVQVSDFGALLVSVRTPDRAGVPADIALGYDQVTPYLEQATSNFFGGLIGRYANRIAGGRFVLDGYEHELPLSDPPNSLHGGERGFHLRQWQAERVPGGVRLRYASPVGEEGYPGALSATVTYTLSGSDLTVDYEAVTDAPTVVNLTQHSYWNLSGDARRDVLDHRLTVRAAQYTPIDETSIPLGPQAAVEGTPFDLRGDVRRDGVRLGDVLNERVVDGDVQLRRARGLDHNFVLDAGALLEPALAARMHDPESGRSLEVWTTQPGLQVYSGNFLDGSLVGREGVPYHRHWAVCLETQHFPDSPNRPEYPSTVLRPGEVYRQRAVFRFG